MQGILPDEVRTRVDRADHDLVFDTALQATDGELMRSIIFSGGPIWNYVDAAAARQLYARLQLRRTHQDSLVMWSIATMSAWLTARAGSSSA
jgi:hypothetical protein